MSGLSKQMIRPLGLLCALTLVIATVNSVSHYQQVQAEDFTIANSDPTQNKARYLSLTDYPRNASNWPRRSQDGCPGDHTYKSMPWLGDSDNLTYKDPSFNPSALVSGDTLTDAGNCNTRYEDGGTGSSAHCASSAFSGAWLCKDAFGGWTNTGSFSWGNACSTVGQSFDPTTYMSGRTPRIWATCSPDMSHADALFRRNNPGYQPQHYSNGRPVRLYGIGSSLFRNEFNLTQTQIDDLHNDVLDPFLQIIADDWYAVYINGVPVVSTTYTAGYRENSIPKSVFQVGQNVIAIQVIDKAYWDTSWAAAGDAAGLWYTLLFRGDIGPPPPPPVSKPFIRFYGGDVLVGAGPQDASCVDGTATIKAFNEGSSPWNGAGTQLAAFAPTQIEGFASAMFKNALRPAGLSFANASGTYGGGWDIDNFTCPEVTFKPDVDHDIPEINWFTWLLGAIVAPEQYHRNDHTINNSISLDRGERSTIYVDGDLTVNANITVADGPYDDPSDIPLLRLVVRGNIYITHNVSQIDAHLIALEIDDTNGGTVYTCMVKAGLLYLEPNPGISSHRRFLNDPDDGCAKSLEINGAILAKELQAWRTFGDIGGQQAERINFGPEAWLYDVNTPLPPGESVEYDSIINLPPVL